mmetsp:Transcript_6197/g.12542  ORF Transcript_6197/g.12542 Transcript_6197/m.12542 type:complete len:290 (+) Transcript_6197:1633-2502(+)
MRIRAPAQIRVHARHQLVPPVVSACHEHRIGPVVRDPQISRTRQILQHVPCLFYMLHRRIVPVPRQHPARVRQIRPCRTHEPLYRPKKPHVVELFPRHRRPFVLLQVHSATQRTHLPSRRLFDAERLQQLPHEAALTDRHSLLLQVALDLHAQDVVDWLTSRDPALAPLRRQPPGELVLDLVARTHAHEVVHVDSDAHRLNFPVDLELPPERHPIAHQAPRAHLGHAPLYILHPFPPGDWHSIHVFAQLRHLPRASTRPTSRVLTWRLDTTLPHQLWKLHIILFTCLDP